MCIRDRKMVAVDRDLLVIPNLAIHMNREVNDGYKYNVQKDMPPLFSDKEGKGRFMETVAEAAEVKTEDILGHDPVSYTHLVKKVDEYEHTMIMTDQTVIPIEQISDIKCEEW